MRKQKSIRWFRYTVEDAKAAQAELDEQAERGWELEEVGLFTATFRRAERPRRCWVEPARWKSERKKDWDARSDYLTLCGEAGWELLEEDGGLFYFRAKEGTDPAPLQTDEDVEWADVWKKALADQVWSLSYLAVYWSIWTVGGYIREHPRMWELFLSNDLHGHGDPCAVVAGNGSVFRGAGAPLPGKMPPGGGRGGALSRTTAVGSQTPGDTPADRGSADCRPRPVASC